jgi:hypothetical protein
LIYYNHAKANGKSGIGDGAGRCLAANGCFAKMDAEEISRIKKSVFVTGEAPAKKERNNAD